MKKLSAAAIGGIALATAIFFFLAGQQSHKQQVSTLKMEGYHMDADTAKWHYGSAQVKAFTPYCVKPGSVKK